MGKRSCLRQDSRFDGAIGMSRSRKFVLFALFAASLAVVWDADTNARSLKGAPQLAKPTPYHHDPAGGFRNLPGSPKRTVSNGEMSQFIKEELLSSNAVVAPDNHVMPRAEAMQQMAEASNPSVTWLGHASFIVRIANKTILTDPFIGKTAGPLGIGPRRFIASPLTVEELPEIDVIVVSHDHYDHLDAHTINNYRHKQSTMIIVPLGLGRFFEKRGYPNVVEQDWWDTWTDDGLTITTLPAVHFSGRGLFDRNKTLWASFAFRSDSESIWFSGDTAAGQIFQEIGAREGPFDLALVAIGAYEPRSIMRSIHASPEEAIQIAREIGAKQAIGMHWGTIRLTPEDAFEPPARFKSAARQQGYGAENANILRIGETFDFPHDSQQGVTAP